MSSICLLLNVIKREIKNDEVSNLYCRTTFINYLYSINYPFIFIVPDCDGYY